ncbi:MAG: hypothetical protein ACRYGI_18935 [Janthinobacterium lividum]
MTDTPVHDWLQPRLRQMLIEAEQAGIERSIAVAVLTDLITGAGSDPVHLSSDIDA